MHAQPITVHIKPCKNVTWFYTNCHTDMGMEGRKKIMTEITKFRNLCLKTQSALNSSE